MTEVASTSARGERRQDEGSQRGRPAGVAPGPGRPAERDVTSANDSAPALHNRRPAWPGRRAGRPDHVNAGAPDHVNAGAPDRVNAGAPDRVNNGGPRRP